MWKYLKMLSLLIGIVYILGKKGNKKLITGTTVMLVFYYLAQIVSDAINGLNFSIDINEFIIMSVFLVSICMLIQEYGVKFITFVYKIFKYIIILNGISVVAFYNKGIIQDAYDTPIYFWATRNHIISLALATVALGYILKSLGLEKRKKYNFFLIYTIIEVLILRSSTAIIAMTCFMAFVVINRVYSYKNRPINLKLTISSGIVLQILLVVFRIQERFSAVISVLFGKDTTLSGRTGLWEQALLTIPSHLFWGQGNSSAAGLNGWLTMSFWNPITSTLDDTYYVAHNQFLEILLNGGLVMLLFFLLAIFFAIRNVRKITDNHIVNIIAGTFFAYLIVMITEVLYPYAPVWIYMIVVSCLNSVLHNEVNENEQIKNYSSYSSL
jgi:O-antigen ligase